MKIIDLLNKIANNEEVPEEIKCDNDKYIWNGFNYYNKEKDDYLDDHICLEDLEYPIEIIEEEEKKIPEKIDMFDYFTGYDFSGTDNDLLNHLEINFETINKSINEIIDYLKSKGE